MHKAKREAVNIAVTAADTATWYVATVLVAVILLSSLMDGSNGMEYFDEAAGAAAGGRSVVGRRPCEEIYVVGEGETLHTISDKCGDPFIVERNPHIHDPDDVFPGLVIMLNPSDRI